MKEYTWRFILAGILLLLAVALSSCSTQTQSTWSDDEKTALRGLWIGSLKSLKQDPSNKYSEDIRAAELGQKLFFDARFSANGKVSCASCHHPDKQFQDGTPLAHGIGTTSRRTMTIIGTAYSPWMFWDGRKDSQWAQALGPLENPVEHGGNRTYYAHLIAEHYHGEYEAVFGALPDLTTLPRNAGPVQDPNTREAWQAMSDDERETVTRIYANMGKAIAAYERHLLPGAARFDAYVEAALNNDAAQMQKLFTAEETVGLKLFIGKANCTQCHNGPLLTDNHFHNTGVPAVDGLPEDTGRTKGAQQVKDDEFNCLSKYSDAKPRDCSELKYMVADGNELMRQFKPPSLRNVDGRGPFMHAGQFATLEEVLQHYSRASDAPAGHSELKPLNLSVEEMQQIIAFLKTLSGPINADPKWLESP